jgi:hypothetical protein
MPFGPGPAPRRAPRRAGQPVPGLVRAAPAGAPGRALGLEFARLAAATGRRRRARLAAAAGLIAAAAVAGAPAVTHACQPQLDAASLPVVPNGIEAGLGATNANAAIGDGGLTATLSRCGEITSLKWPNPSFYDQLDYLTSNAADARALPHMGALDGMGAFAGIAWMGDASSGFSWLRDAGWENTQRYTRSDAAVVENTWTNAALGLRVVGTTWVQPERDVLVEHLEVTRLRGSPVRSARVIFYANFAPTRTRLPEFPIGDTGLDWRNDHALVYDAQEHALLSYIPGETGPGLTDLFFPTTIDVGALDPILRNPPSDPVALQSAVQDAVAGLVDPGIYLALGARGGDNGFQAGFDDAPFCEHQSQIAERAVQTLGLPPDVTALARYAFVCDVAVKDPGGPLGRCRAQRGWTYTAQNAYADAADGVLSGSPLAACHANGALARELSFAHDRADATFYIAAGRTRDAAYALLDEARDPAVPPRLQRARAERWWADWLAPARLPDTDDPNVIRFARRALVSLRTAMDRTSHAIVASVAAQPPYGLDWPRDGAFFDAALDAAGYHDLATAHQAFTLAGQRDDWEAWSIAFPFSCDFSAPSYPDCVPPGTWPMNRYALADESVPGGPVSFEIDETGLPVWALWRHARRLAPAARATQLAAVCPAIAAAAETLATCSHPDDPDPQLQCLAPEDDNETFTQGLQGAETTLLALRTAVEAAPDCGFEAASVSAWAARRDELQAAILDHFLVDSPAPDFDGPRFEGARSAWAIWPAAILPLDDPRMRSHAEFLRIHSIEPVLDRTATGLGYEGEALDARARLARANRDAALLATVRDEVRAFIHLGTTPDTGHMAEFAGRVPIDLDGDGIAPDYLPENDVPHAWQQSILYLAAMQAFGARRGPPPRRCDVHRDGAIDRLDLAAIHAGHGPASGLLDPRDLDEDGRVTELDARGCARRCDRAGCAPAGPHGCGLLGPELLAPLVLLRIRRRWRRGPQRGARGRLPAPVRAASSGRARPSVAARRCASKGARTFASLSK